MTKEEIEVLELKNELSACKDQLHKLMIDQQGAAKLLIRRDLALSRANEQLQALDLAKSEFISIVAHQLRTPLSAIKWILHMLVHNEFTNDGEALEFTQKAAQSTNRMIQLVNDLLEVDHIQSGKDQFIFKLMDPCALISAIASELQTIASRRKVNLSLDLSGCVEIKADATKLRELFQNLIENALKYTPEGGNVKISANTFEGNLRISVKDSGIGIPEDQKYHIFSKFFRAANAMKIETVGSGLGLFIAKEVADRHGGKIWFESKMGEGTTFFVELPLPKSA